MDTRLTAALHVADSILTRNKYLWGLQVVVPGLNVCKRTHDTGTIIGVTQRLKKKTNHAYHEKIR